jgi:hypothetical protein
MTKYKIVVKYGGDDCFFFYMRKKHYKTETMLDELISDFDNDESLVPLGWNHKGDVYRTIFFEQSYLALPF